MEGEQRIAPKVASGFVDSVYWVQDMTNCYGQRAVWPTDLEETLWADDHPDRLDPQAQFCGGPGLFVLVHSLVLVTYLRSFKNQNGVAMVQASKMELSSHCGCSFRHIPASLGT